MINISEMEVSYIFTNMDNPLDKNTRVWQTLWQILQRHNKHILIVVHTSIDLFCLLILELWWVLNQGSIHDWDRVVVLNDHKIWNHGKKLTTMCGQHDLFKPHRGFTSILISSATQMGSCSQSCQTCLQLPKKNGWIVWVLALDLILIKLVQRSRAVFVHFQRTSDENVK